MKHTIIVLTRLAALVSIMLFIACKKYNSETVVNQEFGKLPEILVDTLQKIASPIQHRIVNPAIDTIVVGDQGTILFITAHSLVDAEGKGVNSNIVIELREHYSMGDYVLSNLQTVHNSSILQSQGMIYFNAHTIDGKPVQIAKDKSIRIEFPVKERVSSAQIFKGYRDENGNMNWSSIVEPSKSLISFPIKFLARQMRGECNYPFKDISKYENTLFATREFLERYSICRPELDSIYIHNLDKNMWEVDELIIQQLIKDSINTMNLAQKDTIRLRTRLQKEDHQRWSLEQQQNMHALINKHRGFARQKLTKIDFSRKFSDAEKDSLMNTMNRDWTSSEYSIAYDALEFGWVNVDYFYNDPNAVEIQLVMKTNSHAVLTHLIIPGKQIILSGIEQGDNTYSFTEEGEGYNKLPKGEKAVLIAMSMIDNKLQYADKQIILGQNEIETLKLAPMTGEQIKKRLTF